MSSGWFQLKCHFHVAQFLDPWQGRDIYPDFHSCRFLLWFAKTGIFSICWIWHAFFLKICLTGMDWKIRLNFKSRKFYFFFSLEYHLIVCMHMYSKFPTRIICASWWKSSDSKSSKYSKSLFLDDIRNPANDFRFWVLLIFKSFLGCSHRSNNNGRTLHYLLYIINCLKDFSNLMIHTRYSFPSLYFHTFTILPSHCRLYDTISLQYVLRV